MTNEGMRDREEIERGLNRLVRTLAESGEQDDSTVRVHCRAMMLLWVLHPDVELPETFQLLDDLIVQQRGT